MLVHNYNVPSQLNFIPDKSKSILRCFKIFEALEAASSSEQFIPKFINSLSICKKYDVPLKPQPNDNLISIILTKILFIPQHNLLAKNMRDIFKPSIVSEKLKFTIYKMKLAMVVIVENQIPDIAGGSSAKDLR